MQRAEYWRRMAEGKDRTDLAIAFVAIAKELAQSVDAGDVGKIEAVDFLQELAQAHGLIRKIGQTTAQELMARAFGWRGL